MRSNCVNPAPGSCFANADALPTSTSTAGPDEILARDPLDVVRRDRVHALAKGLQLVQIESVKDCVQDLQCDRARASRCTGSCP